MSCLELSSREKQFGADGRWELRVKGTLTARSDTGAVNHSPTSSAPLTVWLQYGCSHTIRIPGKLCVLFYIVYL